MATPRLGGTGTAVATGATVDRRLVLPSASVQTVQTLAFADRASSDMVRHIQDGQDQVAEAAPTVLHVGLEVAGLIPPLAPRPPPRAVPRGARGRGLRRATPLVALPGESTPDAVSPGSLALGETIAVVPLRVVVATPL